MDQTLSPFAEIELQRVRAGLEAERVTLCPCGPVTVLCASQAKAAGAATTTPSVAAVRRSLRIDWFSVCGGGRLGGGFSAAGC